MKPQNQTTFGDGSDGNEPGNCFAACVASILETPLDQVPNFCAVEDWRDAVNAWLAPWFFYLDVMITVDTDRDKFFAPTGYHVISGPGPRGLRHSVVGLRGLMVHDPHPSGLGLIDDPAEPIEYGFLIPVDPSLTPPACKFPEDLSLRAAEATLTATRSAHRALRRGRI